MHSDKIKVLNLAHIEDSLLLSKLHLDTRRSFEMTVRSNDPLRIPAFEGHTNHLNVKTRQKENLRERCPLGQNYPSTTTNKMLITKKLTHLEEMVEPSQSLDEYVGPLVPELVTSRSKHVQSLVQVEVEVPVKMSPNELVYLVLRQGVQILELVQSRELLHVQPVGRYHFRLAFQEMLRFVT